MAAISDFVKTFIEVPVFCSTFSLCMINPIFLNLIMYRTCYVTLQYNESECTLLGTDKKDNYTQKLEGLVEPDGNIINLVLTLPLGIGCALVTLFLGSWSDRNGRLPVLIASLAGQSLAFAMATVFCLFPDLSAWYLAVTFPPVLLTGGFSSSLAIFLSYITDITDERKRGMRLTIFEITFGLGSLTGTYASAHIFRYAGYVGAYAVASCFLLFAFLFTTTIMKESLDKQLLESSTQQPPFMEEVKTMTLCVFQKRINYDRCIVIICIVITSLHIFANLADLSIIYLFLRVKFGWDLIKFTRYSSLKDVAVIIMTFTTVYGLHKKLKVNETILVLYGLVSYAACGVTQALATSDWQIYLGAFLKACAGPINPMIRSLISKIAKPDEIGKIFAVAVMCQSVLQLVGSPLYTEIYNRTLTSWPSFYNYVTTAVYVIASFLTIVIMVVRNKTTSCVLEESLINNRDDGLEHS